MSITRTIAAATAALLLAGTAQATSFTFDYSANGLLQGTSGSGSFTVAGDNGAFTLASGLDSFDMTGTYSAAVIFFGSYALTKSDLSSFSSTLSNGTLTGLSFVTKTIPVPLTALGIPVGTRRLRFTVNGLDGGNLSVAATSGLLVTRFGGTLDVEAVSGAVPEPASWALMLGGFGLMGYGLRQTRRARGQTALA